MDIVDDGKQALCLFQLCSKKTASESINLQHIMELREAFEAADTDKGGALELNEFVEAFGEIIGKGMSEKELTRLFMKIDANSDGSVDWNEFMNYMLLENESLSTMKVEHFEYQMESTPDPHPHKDPTVHLDMINCILPVSIPTDPPKHLLISGGRDGQIKMLNPATMGLVNNINHSKSWITALIYMEISKKLVVACADRTISFYDMTQKSIGKAASKICDLDGIPLCLDYHYFDDLEKEMLLVGDDLGLIHEYIFKKDWHICDWEVRSQKNLQCHAQEIEDRLHKEMEDYLQDHTWKQGRPDKQFSKQNKTNVHVNEMKIHNGWITKIQYIDELGEIISCSLDGFIHIHKLKELKYSRTFNVHQKGVNTFLWCKSHRFIASCGEERHIILWNEMTLKTITYLYGHTSSIQQLALHNEKHHLLSLGSDKTVKIWDVKTYKCLISLTDMNVYRPENTFMTIVFDTRFKNIVLATRKINIWPFKTHEEVTTSHENAVACALYNTSFESVVSCDDHSNVCVWDMENGKLIFKFSNAHPHHQKITSACFDDTQRRLVTSSQDGTIKMWNFSNGQCLSEMKSADKQEVSRIAHISTGDPDKTPTIVSTGWNRRIYFWPDSKEETIYPSKSLPLTKAIVHNSDINDITFSLKYNMIFTGAADGTLVAWNLETGGFKHFFHEKDPTCLSDNPSRDGKSVEQVMVLNESGAIIAITAGQIMRIFSLENGQLIYKRNLKHGKEECLSCGCISSDENYMISGDTAGNLKLWNLTKFDTKNPLDADFVAIWFISAHKACVNSVQIVFWNEDGYTISAGNDHNIQLHTFEGKFIGFFGQQKAWNLNDMKIQHAVKLAPRMETSYLRKPIRKGSEDEEEEVEEELNLAYLDYVTNKKKKKQQFDKNVSAFQHIDVRSNPMDNIPKDAPRLYDQMFQPKEFPYLYEQISNKRNEKSEKLT